MLPPVDGQDGSDDDAREAVRWDERLIDRLPDVRDGLTRLERVILWQLHVTQRERADRDVPTAMLYGRVVDHVNVSVEEFQRTLSRLVGAR
jgi:hypothetical protein